MHEACFAVAFGRISYHISLKKKAPLKMTQELTPQTSDTSSANEHLSLTDLLAMRMAYERSTIDMYEHFIEKCRDSKDAVVRALDLSRLQPFRETMTEHVNLLTQALDVLGDRAEAERKEEPFLIFMKAAERQVCEAQIPVLPSMQALLAVEQFNEVAWGLLLALMKDAELQRFVAHFEQACMQHREQRIALQQSYEDIVLGLVRRHRLIAKSSRPLKSTLAGRAGVFSNQHPVGRI